MVLNIGMTHHFARRRDSSGEDPMEADDAYHLTGSREASMKSPVASRYPSRDALQGPYSSNAPVSP